MKKSHISHWLMAAAIAVLLPITGASGRSMGGHPGMGLRMGGAPGMGPHMGGPTGMGPRFFRGNGFSRGHEFAFRHGEFGHFRDDRFFRHREFSRFRDFDRDNRFFFHHRDRFFFGFNFVGPGYPYPYWYPWYPGYPWYPYWWY
jgi:hypothetical protein